MTDHGANPGLRSKLYKRVPENKGTMTSARPNARVLNRAEDILDQHLRSGKTVLSTQEVEGLNQVLVILADHMDDESRALKARALIYLGTNKRDRGELAGRMGAYWYYMRARNLLLFEQEPRLSAQVMTYLAACIEMSGLNDLALERFVECEHAANSRGLEQLESMAQLRQATNLTKLGEFRSAEAKLTESIESSAPIVGAEWEIVQKMKAAGFYVASGRLDEALSASEEMSKQIATSGMETVNQGLLLVRGNIAQAVALLKAGEEDAGLDALVSAESIASEREFGHQLIVARSILDHHIGPANHEPPKTRVFKPLTIREILNVDST